MDTPRRWLGLAYVYPLVMIGFSVGSVLIAYRARVDFTACSASNLAGCLDNMPYFILEAAMFLVAGYLSYRAVKRTRNPRKDTWTVRVYWPSVLGVASVLSLVAYAVVAFPSRGCSAGAVTAIYMGYDCWDPAASFLRVAVTGLVTAGVMYAVTKTPGWADGMSTSRRPPGGADGDEAEEGEEIAAPPQ